MHRAFTARLRLLMPDSPPASKWQPLVYLACVLALPALDRPAANWRKAADQRALAERGGKERAGFSPGLLDVMNAHKPDDVFIGDSMVGSRIAADVWKEATGRTAELIWEPGATSARWYLYLKNYVLPASTQPKRIYIFFRDRFWSLPELNVEGNAWVAIERAMPDDDPVIRRVLGGPRMGSVNAIVHTLDAIYPTQFRREDAAKAFADATLGWAAKKNRVKRSEARTALNDEFSFENMRPGLRMESALDVLDQPVPFDSSPDKGFLPALIELIEKHHMPVTLVRVERRPKEDGSRPNNENLRAYLRDLRAYLDQHGVPFVDLSDDQEVTVEKYGEGDHIAKSERPWWTRRFAARMGLATK